MNTKTRTLMLADRKLLVTRHLVIASAASLVITFMLTAAGHAGVTYNFVSGDFISGDSPQHNAGEAVACDRPVHAADQRQDPGHREAERRDAQFQARQDPQGMAPRRHDPREADASQAHAPHERAQQNRQRYRRGADDEAQQVKPDDLIDQRSASAAYEKRHQRKSDSSGFLIFCHAG